MHRSSRFHASSTANLVESLESRRLLSVSNLTTVAEAVTNHPATAVTRTVAAPTRTTISPSTTTSLLGQQVTITAAVAATAKGAKTPTGSVSFYDGKKLLASLPLDRFGRAVFSSYTLFLGKHVIAAVYGGSKTLARSTSPSATLLVRQGPTRKLAGGLQVETVQPGAGRAAAAGDMLKVDYTGYLTNGVLFDTSLGQGRTPFDFQLSAGQVIPGWDEGLVGMKPGETRLLIIPPALGYGPTGQGSIPPNATLLFIVRLIAYDLPRLVVTGNGAAVTNNAAPATANGTLFPSVSVGKTGPTHQFVITNAGDAPLSFTGNLSLSGPDAADFVLQQPQIINNAAVFTVQFKPRAKGARTCRLTIPTNDPTFPAFTFTLSGGGI